MLRCRRSAASLSRCFKRARICAINDRRKHFPQIIESYFLLNKKIRCPMLCALGITIPNLSLSLFSSYTSSTETWSPLVILSFGLFCYFIFNTFNFKIKLRIACKHFSHLYKNIIQPYQKSIYRPCHPSLLPNIIYPLLTPMHWHGTV